MISKITALLFVTTGIFLIAQITLPILSFKFLEFVYAQDEKELISPQTSKRQVLGISIQTTDNFPAFVSSNNRDSKPNYSNFLLSIPSLEIKNGIVALDSNDLNEGLAHLPGSGLAGERGNVFISGHSAVPVSLRLPKIFQKSPTFANLPDIKKGAEVIVTAGGIKYIYKVIEIKIVKPDDVSVINPPDASGRYITLMTCVPPGLNTKRLIVVGKLI